MVYLNVDGKFFVDEPTVYPTGLDVYSRPVPESVKRQPDVGNVKIRLLDRETVNGACKEILGSPTPAISRGGGCIVLADTPYGGIWKDIRGAYQVGSYCYGEDCHYDQKGYEISFSGVKERPWNGAALRFASRRAFKEKRSIIGVLCYFDRNRRERFISELETTRMSTSKIVFPTSNGGLRLFEGSEALDYMHRRFRDSVGSKLIFSVFDPNVRHAVQQRTLEFSGYNLDTGFRDGFVFRDYESCQKVRSLHLPRKGKNRKDFADSVPGEIVRLFELTTSRGRLEPLEGVDRLESSDQEY